MSTAYSSTTRTNPGMAAPSVASSYATADTRVDFSVPYQAPLLYRNESMRDQRAPPSDDTRSDSRRERDFDRRQYRSSSEDRPTVRKSSKRSDKDERRRDDERGDKSKRKDSKRAVDEHDAQLVHNQFPGEEPDTFTAPYLPGLAADYYGDHGESVADQPGVRPVQPYIVTNAEYAHLHEPTVEAAPPPEPSALGQVGAAADYFGAMSDEDTKALPEPSYSSSRSGAVPALQSTGSVGSRVQSGVFNGPPSLSDGPSTMPQLGSTVEPGLAGEYFSNSFRPDLTEGGRPDLEGGYVGSHNPDPTATPYSQGPQPGYSNMPYTDPSSGPYPQVPSSIYGGAHNADPTQSSSRPPGPSKTSSSSNMPVYGAAAAGLAAAGAGAYYAGHHTSAQHESVTGVAPGSYAQSVEQSQYSQNYSQSSTGMQQKRKRRGPLSRLLDLIQDPKDIAEFEAYTEAIGICKFCFDPNSSPRDAPRQHHYTLRSQGHQGDRRYGSNTRVDKLSRYSSDEERRKTSSNNGAKIIATGLAGYGAAKLAENVAKRRDDFDDTYSVKSGRPEARSRVSFVEQDASLRRRRHSSPEKFSETTRLRNDKRTGEPNERKTSRPRRDSSGSDRFSKGAAISTGIAAAGLAGIAASGRRNRSRSQSPKKRGKYYSKRISPNHSYVDLSATQLGTPLGGIGSFFTSPSANKREKKKQKGLFNWNNASSSSSDADLAFGAGSVRRKKTREDLRKQRRESGDVNAEILGLAATGAALAAEGDRQDRKGKRRAELLAGKEARNGRVRPGSRGRKHNDSSASGEDDEGWLDVSDGESSADSALAYGGRIPARQSRDSLSGQGTDKWDWRWQNGKNAKKRRSQEFDPVVGPLAAGLAGAAVGAGVAGSRRINRDERRTSQQPLQQVYPVPTSDPTVFEAVRKSSAISPMTPQESGVTALHQPQPYVPISQSMYASQNTTLPPYTPSGPPIFEQYASKLPISESPKQISADLAYRRPDGTSRRRRNSSPTPNHERYEMDDRPRRRESKRDSVKFDLDEEQQRRERRSEDREKRRPKRSNREGGNAAKISDLQHEEDDLIQARRSSGDAKSARELEIERRLEQLREEDRLQEEARQAKRSDAGSSVGTAAALAAGAGVAAIIASKEMGFDGESKAGKEERRSRRKSSLKKSRYEEEDRSESQQGRIAQMASQRVKQTPSPAHEDYGNFFVPPELAANVKEHNYAANHREDAALVEQSTDTQIVRKQSGRSHTFDEFTYRPFGISPEDNPKMFPWRVPVLDLVEPTPPGSVRAASPLPPKSPEPAEREERTSKRSSIVWGEDQTHTYEVETPLTDREEFVTDKGTATYESSQPAIDLAERTHTDIKPELSEPVTVTVNYSSYSREKGMYNTSPSAGQQELEEKASNDDRSEVAMMLPATTNSSNVNPNAVSNDSAYSGGESLGDPNDLGSYKSPFAEIVSDLGNLGDRSAALPPQVAAEGDLPSTPANGGSTTRDTVDQKLPVGFNVMDYLDKSTTPPRTEIVEPALGDVLVEESSKEKRRNKKNLQSEIYQDSRDIVLPTSNSGASNGDSSVLGTAAESILADDDINGQRIRKQKSKRRSGDDYDEFPPPVSASEPGIELSRSDSKKSKRKSKQGSDSVDEDDTKSVASEPADVNGSKRSSGKKDKKSGSFWGLLAGSIAGGAGPRSSDSKSSKSKTREDDDGSVSSSKSMRRSKDRESNGRSTSRRDRSDSRSSAKSERDVSLPSEDAKSFETVNPGAEKARDEVKPFLGGRPELPTVTDGVSGPTLSKPTEVRQTKPADTSMGLSEAETSSIRSHSISHEATTPTSNPRSVVIETSTSPPVDRDELRQRHLPDIRTSDIATGPGITQTPSAVPLHFKRFPVSPGSARSASVGSPAPPSATSPLTTPRTRQGRPTSTEFRNSKEFRPLYLVERNMHAKQPELEAEEIYPSLPSSRTSSAHPSMENLRGDDREDVFESAQAGPITPEEIRTRRQSWSYWNDRPKSPDYLDSSQATPTATEFPKDILMKKEKPKYEFHSPSELLEDPSVHRAEVPEPESPMQLPSITSSVLSSSRDEPESFLRETTDREENHARHNEALKGAFADVAAGAAAAAAKREYTQKAESGLPQQDRAGPGEEELARHNEVLKGAFAGVAAGAAALASRRVSQRSRTMSTPFEQEIEKKRESRDLNEESAETSTFPVPTERSNVEALVDEPAALETPTGHEPSVQVPSVEVVDRSRAVQGDLGLSPEIEEPLTPVIEPSAQAAESEPSLGVPNAPVEPEDDEWAIPSKKSKKDKKKKRKTLELTSAEDSTASDVATVPVPFSETTDAAPIYKTQPDEVRDIAKEPKSTTIEEQNDTTNSAIRPQVPPPQEAGEDEWGFSSKKPKKDKKKKGKTRPVYQDPRDIEPSSFEPTPLDTPPQEMSTEQAVKDNAALVRDGAGERDVSVREADKLKGVQPGEEDHARHNNELRGAFAGIAAAAAAASLNRGNSAEVRKTSEDATVMRESDGLAGMGDRNSPPRGSFAEEELARMDTTDMTADLDERADRSSYPFEYDVPASVPQGPEAARMSLSDEYAGRAQLPALEDAFTRAEAARGLASGVSEQDALDTLQKSSMPDVLLKEEPIESRSLHPEIDNATMNPFGDDFVIHGASAANTPYGSPVQEASRLRTLTEPIEEIEEPKEDFSGTATAKKDKRKGKKARVATLAESSTPESYSDSLEQSANDREVEGQDDFSNATASKKSKKSKKKAQAFDWNDAVEVPEVEPPATAEAEKISQDVPAISEAGADDSAPTKKSKKDKKKRKSVAFEQEPAEETVPVLDDAPSVAQAVPFVSMKEPADIPLPMEDDDIQPLEEAANQLPSENPPTSHDALHEAAHNRALEQTAYGASSDFGHNHEGHEQSHNEALVAISSEAVPALHAQQHDQAHEAALEQTSEPTLEQMSEQVPPVDPALVEEDKDKKSEKRQSTLDDPTETSQSFSAVPELAAAATVIGVAGAGLAASQSREDDRPTIENVDAEPEQIDTAAGPGAEPAEDFAWAPTRKSKKDKKKRRSVAWEDETSTPTSEAPTPAERSLSRPEDPRQAAHEADAVKDVPMQQEADIARDVKAENDMQAHMDSLAGMRPPPREESVLTPAAEEEPQLEESQGQTMEPTVDKSLDSEPADKASQEEPEEFAWATSSKKKGKKDKKKRGSVLDDSQPTTPQLEEQRQLTEELPAVVNPAKEEPEEELGFSSKRSKKDKKKKRQTLDFDEAAPTPDIEPAPDAMVDVATAVRQDHNEELLQDQKRVDLNEPESLVPGTVEQISAQPVQDESVLAEQGHHAQEGPTTQDLTEERARNAEVAEDEWAVPNKKSKKDKKKKRQSNFDESYDVTPAEPVDQEMDMVEEPQIALAEPEPVVPKHKDIAAEVEPEASMPADSIAAAPAQDWGFSTTKNKKNKKKKRQSTLDDSYDVTPAEPADANVATEQGGQSKLAEPEPIDATQESIPAEAGTERAGTDAFAGSSKDEADALPVAKTAALEPLQDWVFSSKKSKKEKKKNRASAFEDDVSPRSSVPEEMSMVEEPETALVEPEAIIARDSVPSEVERNVTVSEPLGQQADEVVISQTEPVQSLEPGAEEEWGFSSKKSKKDKQKKRQPASEELQDPFTPESMEARGVEVVEPADQSEPNVEPAVEEWPSTKKSKKDKKKKTIQAWDNEETPTPQSTQTSVLGNGPVVEPAEMVSEPRETPTSYAEPMLVERAPIDVPSETFDGLRDVPAEPTVPTADDETVMRDPEQAAEEEAWGFPVSKKGKKGKKSKRESVEPSTPIVEPHGQAIADPPTVEERSYSVPGGFDNEPEDLSSFHRQGEEQIETGTESGKATGESYEGKGELTEPARMQESRIERESYEPAQSYEREIYGPQEWREESKDTAGSFESALTTKSSRKSKKGKKGRQSSYKDDDVQQTSQDSQYGSFGEVGAAGLGIAAAAAAAASHAARDTDDAYGRALAQHEAQHSVQHNQAMQQYHPRPESAEEMTQAKTVERSFHSPVYDRLGQHNLADPVAAAAYLEASHAENTHQDERSPRALPRLEDKPTWSFNNLADSAKITADRDSGIQFESPVTGTEPFHRSVRDSGYAASPSVAQGHDHIHLQRPPRPSSPTSSAEDVNVNTRRRQSPSVEGAQESERQPSPVTSTSKDRSSKLFHSSPSAQREVEPQVAPLDTAHLAGQSTELHRSPSIHGHGSQGRLRSVSPGVSPLRHDRDQEVHAPAPMYEAHQQPHRSIFGPFRTEEEHDRGVLSPPTTPPPLQTIHEHGSDLSSGVRRQREVSDVGSPGGRQKSVRRTGSLRELAGPSAGAFAAATAAAGLAMEHSARDEPTSSDAKSLGGRKSRTSSRRSREGNPSDSGTSVVDDSAQGRGEGNSRDMADVYVSHSCDLQPQLTLAHSSCVSQEFNC